MKTKLLLALSLLSLQGFSQTPIASYYGTGDGAFTDMTTATPLDQSAFGPNANWNFTNLTINGTVTDMNQAPAPGELTTYPNTTNKVLTYGTVDGNETTSMIFSRVAGNDVYVTGIYSDGLRLAYDTNEAFGGTFPMSFGYLNPDTVAGSYVYTTYTGTFTGNLTTSVDAYGTLSVGTWISNVPVTRVKTTQNLNLSYPGFGVVGTVMITGYSYYDGNIASHYPIFRTATTTMIVPLLSINQTKTRIEAFTASLGVADFSRSASIKIAQNPVADVLRIESDSNLLIRSVAVTDMQGRQALSVSNPGSDINCSHLQNGVYLATITTDEGVVTRKFIKK